MKRVPILLTLLGFFAAVAACEPGADGLHDAAQKKIVRRGNGGEPGTLDPAHAVDIHAFNILVDLYEGLVAEDAGGRLVPGTAESWQISEDGLVYTFVLRPDARWSNGESLVASDIVRSIRRIASSETPSGYANLLHPILSFADVLEGNKPVEDLGVAALSANVVEFRLSRPSSQFLSVLALPIAYPTHVSGDGKLISNGAFALEDRELGGPITLRRNNYYWDADSVELDEVVYVPIVDPMAEFNMYRAGELDITSTLPGQLLATARKKFGPQVRISPSLALYYLAFDLSEAPFDSKPLRQALTMAIDREQLTKLIGRGEQPAYSVVPPGVAGYESAQFGWRSQSKERREQSARDLYSQAGYSAARPLTFKYVYDAGDDVHERVALAVTAMWRDVLGIESALDKREWKYFLDTRDNRREWDVMRFAWFGDYNAAQTFLDIFHSESSQNLSGYNSKHFDNLMATAGRETDNLAAAQFLRNAESDLIADYPISPLYFFVSKHMVKSHIAGFQDNIVDRHPSRFLDIVNQR